MQGVLMMKRKPLSAVFAVLLLALSLVLAPAGAEESFNASAMRLLNFLGDVQILDAEGLP